MTRIIFFACDVPKTVEGSGLQNQEVRGMHSAMRKSVAERECKYQIFLVDDWEEPVQYR